jgi:hypothetical protein
MTTSLSRGFGIVSRPGALAVPIMRFFWSEFTSAPSIRLRLKVYVFGISFATASRLRFGAMTTLYCETEEERRGEENLTAKPSEFKPLVCGSRQRGGVAQGSSPFL